MHISVESEFIENVNKRHTYGPTSTKNFLLKKQPTSEFRLPKMELKSPQKNTQELELPFPHSNLEFDSTLEFSHKRRYQTEFSTLSQHTFEESFQVGKDLFQETNSRTGRIRSISLSLPQNSISNAFGPSVFASMWEPDSHGSNTNATEPAEDVTLDAENDETALARTIDYLGLDDLLNSPTIASPRNVRPRSVSFQESIIPPAPFLHSRSSTLAILEGNDSLLNAHCSPEIPSWDEMAERYQKAVQASSSPKDDRSEQMNHEFMAPSRSLWIGNIDSNLTSDDLTLIFSRFGTIESIRMLPEKECAFVNFLRLDDAITARDHMQGGRIGNCIVRIGFGKTEAIQETPAMQPTKSLWVGNITPNTKPAELEAMFAKFGQVESARVLVKMINKTHKNCGFVNFVDLEDAITARNELNGQEVNGSVVKIGFAKVPSKAEPVVPQALGNPTVMAGLATAALDRLYTTGAWKEKEGDKKELYLSISAIPESALYKKFDTGRLRDIRKRVEGNISTSDLDTIFNELKDDFVDLSSDYIGNVIIQKLVEKGSEVQKLQIIQAVSKCLASLGVHKNGTWAVQKIIDCAKTSAQIKTIVEGLRSFVPALLLDQFGNYVIQCCLRLGEHRNQFIFDAMANRCWELGQGRFGARAMKACLESQFTTKAQQKQVSLAIIQNCVQLSMNSNGSILVTWLLDSSQVPGRYRVLAPLLQPHLNILCCHKLSSMAVLKIINQRVETDAQDIIIRGIFHNSSTLKHILQDQAVGVPAITKILNSGCTNAEQRQKLVKFVKIELDSLKLDSSTVYKKLWDELVQNSPKVKLETPKDFVAPHTEFFPKSFGSPARHVVPQSAEEPLPPLYPPKTFLPTPNQSPQYYNTTPYYPNQNLYGYTPYYPGYQNDDNQYQ